jgi:hypothetical protein
MIQRFCDYTDYKLISKQFLGTLELTYVYIITRFDGS